MVLFYVVPLLAGGDPTKTTSTAANLDILSTYFSISLMTYAAVAANISTEFAGVYFQIKIANPTVSAITVPILFNSVLM